jgi:clavulanate-9-aldehyde reducatase
MRKALVAGLVVGAGVAIGTALRRSSPQSVQGKVVLITGASSGIGRATAHAFAAQGARLALLARRISTLEEVCAELEPYRVPVVLAPADVTDSDQLAAAVDRVYDAFGCIDILINNAGVTMGGPHQNLAEERLRQMLAVNIYGPLRLTQLVLPGMLRQRGGHIVNVGSVMGLISPPGAAAYAATRAAVRAFSESLRREVRGTGIGVSTVMPGWTKTEMVQHIDWSELRRAGLLSVLATLDEARVPAQAIVYAVRYSRREILLGGLQMQAGAINFPLTPYVLDWYFRLFTSNDLVLEAMRQLGV